MPGRGDERVPAPLFATVPSGGEDVGGGSAPSSVDGERSMEPGAAGSPGPGAEAQPGPPEEPGPPRDRTPPEREAPGPDGRQAQIDITSAAVSNTVAGRRRPARYGLLVQFESRPDDLELARLVDSTIWINDAHPAYTRAAGSRSLGYHTALAVGLALAPLAVEPPHEHAFITQFLASWGGAQAPARRAGGRGARRQDVTGAGSPSSVQRGNHRTNSDRMSGSRKSVPGAK
jgi:hypothetical protein